ncbi:MAG: two-component system activity regulator YycH [Bacillota bacterium]
MKREHVKSVVLFSLVILSFVLTTRLWFNISIEGFFIMSGRDKAKNTENTIKYDITTLLKPNKIIINTNEKEILLRNSSSNDFYDSVLNDSILVLKQLLSSKEIEYLTQSVDVLSDVRKTKSIELILSEAVEANTIVGLLKLESNPHEGIRSINEFIICPLDKKAYIFDKNQNKVFEFKVSYLEGGLELMLQLIEKVNSTEESISHLYLNDIVAPEKDAGPEAYTIDKNAIVPINLLEMPVLSIESEIHANGEITDDIRSFFDDNDDINIIIDEEGIVKYTDRDEESVWVSDDGTIEYFNNSTYNGGQSSISLHDAIKLSADYIDRHMGFPEDSYLSEIEREDIGSKTVYVIRYKYRYEGLPIIVESGIYSHSIEVKIDGDQVRRYKRMVKKISYSDEFSKINFINAFDTISGRNKKELIPKGERISKINDMYLAYYERSSSLIPVWVVDVEIENMKSEKGMPTENKKYIVYYDNDSNTGHIIDEL